MDKPISFMPEAWEDYLYWQAQDKKTLKKVNQLLQDITRSSFTGIGKPEPLKHDKSGYWSRRIDSENRITYKVTDDAIIIVSCRTHYNEYR